MLKTNRILRQQLSMSVWQHAAATFSFLR